MNIRRKERRKHARYDTTARIYFHVHYDLKTRVKFQFVNKKEEKGLSKKYPGVTRNVSVEGLRFHSHKKLRKGSMLYLEMYLPKRKDPVCMIGEVRWSKKMLPHHQNTPTFDTGVRLISAMGKSVSKSVHLDKKYQIFWSIVLEHVFGSFRKWIRARKYKNEKDTV